MFHVDEKCTMPRTLKLYIIISKYIPQPIRFTGRTPTLIVHDVRDCLHDLPYQPYFVEHVDFGVAAASKGKIK